MALAKAQSKDGLISKKELADLVKNQDKIDIQRIIEIEETTRHDVVAALKEFAEKAKVGGGKIHLGATSMDIVDNADSVNTQEALQIIEDRLKQLLSNFKLKIKNYAALPCMGYTHLQPAEPTTLGYRFALYAQDLLWDWELLQWVKKNLKAKGMKGAVGTAASYEALTKKNIESDVMDDLGLDPVLIANQTNPRKVDYFVAVLLASIAQSLHKFAFDLRIMQSAGWGEWQEPFGKSQVGSSAMPFKKNPIKSEQICSLARLVVSLSRNAWDNASLSLLERTLDDSANRRVYIPEMFLAIDEMLASAAQIVEGLVINEKRIRQNLENYAPFAATEAIIIEAVKRGADRQKMHEILREVSMKAWQAIQDGQENPMKDLLLNNKNLVNYLTKLEIIKLLDVKKHIGTAPKRALKLVKEINKI